MQRYITTSKLDRSPPSTTAVEFDEVAGVEIRADTTAPYDTWGRGVLYVGPVLPHTLEVLEATIRDLQRLAGRKPKALVLASVWRKKKPGEKVNRHTEGRAIDIGGIWWTERDGTTAWSYPQNPRDLLACEAVIRLSWGTVLSWEYNAKHHHHIHADTGGTVGVTAAELAVSKAGFPKVEVTFLQAALTHVLGRPVKIDGLWGDRETAPAVAAVLEELGAPADITDPRAWAAFCTAVAMVGFGRVEVGG